MDGLLVPRVSKEEINGVRKTLMAELSMSKSGNVSKIMDVQNEIDFQVRTTSFSQNKHAKAIIVE